jgi:poly(3-hydroxybutyrate) depolymerase
VLYRAYQTQADATFPIREGARWLSARLDVARNGSRADSLVRALAAVCTLLGRAGLSHRRPAFGIANIRVTDEAVAVHEESKDTTPFATLLHFRKETRGAQPPVLLVAPLSGHFATLLRGTVETLLPDHDVYITDWHNARDVSLAYGSFGFSDYVAHLIRFLEAIGPGAHVVAVCQPCVQVLAAVAMMAEVAHPAQPRSMTLIAGPIDTRVNPTRVNELAASRSIEWFERNLISPVPLRFAGAFRRVYPGFLQLAAFMSMNMERHLKAFAQMFDDLATGEVEKARATQAFYDEYFAVSDLPAEFYLETVRIAFQEHLLPCGRLECNGRPVDLRAIRHTALLTVEGERDDICAVGQTAAAHELCVGLKPYMKRHHLQPGVGHYGVFSGTRWATQIYPIVRNMILASC